MQLCSIRAPSVQPGSICAAGFHAAGLHLCSWAEHETGQLCNPASRCVCHMEVGTRVLPCLGFLWGLKLSTEQRPCATSGKQEGAPCLSIWFCKPPSTYVAAAELLPVAAHSPSILFVVEHV